VRKIPRRGGQEKPPGHQHHAAVIPLRAAAEGPWATVDHLLLPEARPDLEQLVCEGRAYCEMERSVDPTALLRRWRNQVRTVAADAEAAVPELFDDLRILCSWTTWTELVGLEPESAMTFRTAAARFEAQWRLYLMRLQGAAGRLIHHREGPGPRRSYVREVVIDQLIRIVTTYRRDKKGALLGHKGRFRDEPYGVLFDVAVALRDSLPCLPRGDAALWSALYRARARARRRRKLSPAPTNNVNL
jgi:hypothetical protein